MSSYLSNQQSQRASDQHQRQYNGNGALWESQPQNPQQTQAQQPNYQYTTAGNAPIQQQQSGAAALLSSLRASSNNNGPPPPTASSSSSSSRLDGSNFDTNTSNWKAHLGKPVNEALVNADGAAYLRGLRLGAGVRAAALQDQNSWNRVYGANKIENKHVKLGDGIIGAINQKLGTSIPHLENGLSLVVKVPKSDYLNSNNRNQFVVNLLQKSKESLFQSYASDAGHLLVSVEKKDDSKPGKVKMTNYKIGTQKFFKLIKNGFLSPTAAVEIARANYGPSIAAMNDRMVINNVDDIATAYNKYGKNKTRVAQAVVSRLAAIVQNPYAYAAFLDNQIYPLVDENGVGYDHTIAEGQFNLFQMLVDLDGKPIAEVQRVLTGLKIVRNTVPYSPNSNAEMLRKTRTVRLPTDAEGNVHLAEDGQCTIKNSGPGFSGTYGAESVHHTRRKELRLMDNGQYKYLTRCVANEKSTDPGTSTDPAYMYNKFRSGALSKKHKVKRRNQWKEETNVYVPKGKDYVDIMNRRQQALDDLVAQQGQARSVDGSLLNRKMTNLRESGAAGLVHNNRSGAKYDSNIYQQKKAQANATYSLN